MICYSSPNPSTCVPAKVRHAPPSGIGAWLPANCSQSQSARLRHWPVWNSLPLWSSQKNRPWPWWRCMGWLYILPCFGYWGHHSKWRHDHRTAQLGQTRRYQRVVAPARSQQAGIGAYPCYWPSTIPIRNLSKKKRVFLSAPPEIPA